MRTLWIVLLVAACGANSPPNQPPQSSAPAGSGSAAPAPSSEPTGAICGTRGAAACPENMFCSYEPGADCGETDKPGHCTARAEMCAEIYKPVCGCDGKTYSNACTAAAAAVGVRAEGACK